jgi:hypothetical protein
MTTDKLNKLRIPDDLYAQLRLEAERERRSAAGQLAAILSDRYAPKGAASNPQKGRVK